MSLPLIPEPVALKEAYQRGELTQDEVLNLLIYGTKDALRVERLGFGVNWPTP